MIVDSTAKVVIGGAVPKRIESNRSDEDNPARCVWGKLDGGCNMDEPVNETAIESITRLPMK